MGVPVAARNIFPSNIQGLPTWYEVRVVRRGWRGRRGGVDLMVAMNPQTWDKDVAEIEPGGYLFYDSTKPLPPSTFRDDVTPLGMPLDRDLQRRRTPTRGSGSSSRTSSTSARCRRCSTSTPAEIERLLRRAVQGQGSAARVESQGASAGPRLRARELRVPAADPAWRAAMPSATASSSTATAPRRSARVYGGATVAAWYPITPSSSLAEAFPKYCRKFRIDPATRQEALRDRAGRGRARRRSAW